MKRFLNDAFDCVRPELLLLLTRDGHSGPILEQSNPPDSWAASVIELRGVCLVLPAAAVQDAIDAG